MSRKKSLVLLITTSICFICFIFFYYKNIFTTLGFEISNVHWDSWIALLNVNVVVLLYVITYIKMDKRTVERENNKKEASRLMIVDCYNECLKFMDYLNQEVVEKYILPKIDFNSSKNIIIDNLQNSPFINQNVIVEFMKDGQISKKQIESYYKIKHKFNEYINARIVFFDQPKLYVQLGSELKDILTAEKRNLDQ